MYKEEEDKDNISDLGESLTVKIKESFFTFKFSRRTKKKQQLLLFQDFQR